MAEKQSGFMQEPKKQPGQSKYDFVKVLESAQVCTARRCLGCAAPTGLARVSGQGLAWRTLLYSVTLLDQQDADCHQDPVHQGAELKLGLLHMRSWQGSQLILGRNYSQAVKIALELKKYLVDREELDVSQVQQPLSPGLMNTQMLQQGDCLVS